MDRIALDLGFIQIYWYSIMIFLAIIAATFVIVKEMKRKGLTEEFMVNLFFNVIVIGIIGARLYYVLFDLQYYISNPLEILQIWKGGLAIHGGLIAGFIALSIYCKKFKVKSIKILDIVVVGLIIGQAIGRWGNFFNSEAYGLITTVERLQSAGIPDFVIKGMYILGDYRQPTFFYESVWNTVGFFAMLMIRRFYPYLKTGQLSGFYLIWYGTIRIVVEAMRTDSLMLGPLKVAQLVSVIMIGIGLYLFFIKPKRDGRKENLYSEKINIKEETV